jgi:carboxyl-terminal processing protease
LEEPTTTPEPTVSKDNRQSRIITIAAIVVMAGVAFAAGRMSQDISFGKKTSGLDVASLQTVYDVLNRKFDGTLDQEKLLEGAKAGLVAASGDPFTSYLPKAAAKALEDDLSGTLSGIGAEIAIKNQHLTVVAPLADSPADKAGLRAGDIIGAIDGKDPSGLSLDEAVAKIRGTKGTTVKLTVVHGSDAPKEITITRDELKITSVDWSMKDNQVGYIKIKQFSADTSTKIQEASKDLADKGAKKIVLDLRNDPGGYLDKAVTVASEFLKSGQLVVDERRGNTSIEKLNAEDGGRLIGLPMVVLINSGSASASEIVAGALQDHKVATIMGETSFGKGSVQEITKLAEGAEVKVTVAHWYTPNGKNIGKEGIKPDKEVKLSTDDYNANRDPQLDAAQQFLATQ